MQSSHISIIIASYLFIDHHSILAIPNTVYTVIADIGCGCGQTRVAFSKQHYYLYRYLDREKLCHICLMQNSCWNIIKLIGVLSVFSRELICAIQGLFITFKHLFEFQFVEILLFSSPYVHV